MTPIEKVQNFWYHRGAPPSRDELKEIAKRARMAGNKVKLSKYLKTLLRLNDIPYLEDDDVSD